MWQHHLNEMHSCLFLSLLICCLCRGVYPRGVWEGNIHFSGRNLLQKKIKREVAFQMQIYRNYLPRKHS